MLDPSAHFFQSGYSSREMTLSFANVRLLDTDSFSFFRLFFVGLEGSSTNPNAHYALFDNAR